MQHFLDTILAITDKAEEIPKRYFREALDIEHKGDASPVTIADQQCERAIRDGLAKHFPEHSIFGEEFGQTETDSAYRWIIDPIDGTRSFISGMPLYGMLIALLKDGAPILGLLRMPELGEVYTGTKDGAFLNNTKRLHVSDTTDLDAAFIYINEADKIAATHTQQFQNLMIAGLDRRFSYDCYPHALVAAGHIDACVDFDLKPYDYLPLVAIIEAAGGIITDWDGHALTLQSDGRVVSAATPALHAALLECLK